MAETTPAYTRDREKCVVCGHYLGSHDGLPPYKCMIGDCVCGVFVPRADHPPIRDGAQ